MTNFQQLLQMGQKMQARMTELQNELEKKTVESTSGGGMVKVTADAKGRVRTLKIDPTVVDPDDVEMLEDLVLAAISDAQTRAEKVYAEEMKKATGGMNLPFDLPGMP